MSQQFLTAAEFKRLLAAQPVSAEQYITASDSQIMRLLASVDRVLLDRIMTEQLYEPRQIVFQEGDYGDALYLIWSGRVAVVKGDFLTPTVVLYRGPGEIVGEMAVLEDKPRSASVVALEELRLLRIDRGDFKLLVNSQPAISMNIMASLSARLRVAHDISSISTKIGLELSDQVSTLQSENQQLLELDRVRQETTDLIIHDLRNPLGTLQTAIQMLEVVLPKDVLAANAELLEIGNASLLRMQRLVDSLLDVAGLESGAIQLELTYISLPALIHEAASPAAFAATRRGVEFEIDLSADLPPVIIDEERIRRVLTNLIDNAVKFMVSGGRLTITAVAQADHMLITVSDTGPGIPPEDRERIFERFAQVDGKKSQTRGFGLGLAFCKLAIEAHGGRIWVEPGANDAGSRFLFTLPLGDK